MSSKKEIPKSQWDEFLKAFTRIHREWLVSIMQNGNASIHNQPFSEIRIGEGKMFLGAGDYFLVIEQPLTLALTTTDQGADESLEINSATGKVSVVIESPKLPEMVDGIP